ncbi:MAG: EAL domain-containing protein [Rhodobacterales bacterium]|nr:EAL domain-containing protein [Rhodobacterales bacterium]
MAHQVWKDATDVAGGLDSPLAHAVAEADREVLAMVRRAVQRRQVMLAWQPVVLAADPARVAFHEGLLRVLDDTGRIIPARDFMSAVETTDLGRLLDCAALELGLDALIAQPDLRLSVNMSARSIGYPRWLAVLRQGLAADRTVGERLILEITESSAMLMPEITVAFMDDLQREGIAFALDDFGAGYTAFRYFRDFFFDILKIDGQFIRGIAQDPDNQVLTQALVSIGKHFDMLVVAEEVETQAEADFLAALGVDCLQGYLFGAPSLRPVWDQGGDRRRA